MMASLTQQQRYGLKNNHNNNTLFHVKLTDSALRSLEAFQNLKGSLPGQPSICFKGNQGYIKIPVSAGGDGADSSSTVRVFSFYLSTDSKDQPQASFDCVHQHVTSDGRDHLEGQGSIQDKITVCATDDSYQMTRERMSQVEKDSWSRSAIEIKPGPTHPSKCVKFQKRPGALLSVSDSCVQKHSPTTRRTTPPGSLANQRPLKERIDAPLGPVANHRSLRERIIHLLAVKPYRKAELVLWLEREKATPKDKADLGSVLDEVARVNVKDGSYVLKEELNKQLQRDRPGYAEEERQLTSSKTDGKEDRQLMGRMLTGRKLQVHSSGSGGQSRGVHGNMSMIHKVPGDSPSVLNVSGESPRHQSTVRNPTMKRPVPSDAQQDSLAAKRQRPANQTLRPQPPPANQPLISQGGQDPATPTPTPLNASFLTDTAFQRTSNHAGSQNGVSPPPMHKLSSSPDTPLCVSDSARQGGPTAGAQKRAPPGDSEHRKRKSKKHKDKERERLKNNPGCLESSPELKHNPDKLDNPDITNCVSSPLQGKPDYLTTYLTITSVEQRQLYQDDFCAEYDEYKDLHSRIATVTHLFVQLGHKIKTLSPGTQEYKILEDQILEKYTKYRKTFPDARAEKRHCQYLHEKLSHIKRLITDYDVLHNAS